MTRTVNVERLREVIEARGHLGKEKLSLETELVSVAGLNKMMCTKRAPNLLAQERLSKATGIPVDVLFPPTLKKRKSA